MITSLSPARALSPASETSGRAPRIEVGIDEGPGEVVVRLGGEAGVGQAGELTAALLRLSAARTPLLTLDLSGLRFISSLAMGLLVDFRRGVVRSGRRVRLSADLDGSVRETLERAGLLALFGSPDGAPGRG
jgi:anti-anti-sigma factor